MPTALGWPAGVWGADRWAHQRMPGPHPRRTRPPPSAPGTLTPNRTVVIAVGSSSRQTVPRVLARPGPQPRAPSRIPPYTCPGFYGRGAAARSATLAIPVTAESGLPRAGGVTDTAVGAESTSLAGSPTTGASARSVC